MNQKEDNSKNPLISTELSQNLDDEIILNHVDKITKLARSSWIALTFGCLYSWLTIATLNDETFFEDSEPLKLPIISVEISNDGFFIFAPFLLVTAYIYFHLILLQLWRSYSKLGSGKRLISGFTISERVTPWMLTYIIRQPGFNLDWLGFCAAVFFGWIFAPFTIFALGFRYLRAQTDMMSFFHCGALAITIISAIAFWLIKQVILDDRKYLPGLAVGLASTISLWVLLFTLSQLLVFKGDVYPSAPQWLTARAQLHRQTFGNPGVEWTRATDALIRNRIHVLLGCVEPAEQLSFASAPDVKFDSECITASADIHRTYTEVRAELKVLSNLLSEVTGARLGMEEASGHEVRETEHRDVEDATDWCESSKVIRNPVSLRGADIRQAFLVKANFRCAQLDNADLRGGLLDAGDFRGASLMKSNLGRAEMSKTDLRGARAEEADFSGTQLLEANLSDAKLSGAWMLEAKLHGATLENAKIDSAFLVGSQLVGADLSDANLENSTLKGVNFNGAFFHRTIVADSMFCDCEFDEPEILSPTAAFRSVDFSKAKSISADFFSRSFGDASVTLPENIERPEHWSAEILSEEVFFGRWRYLRECQGLPWPPYGNALLRLADQEAIPPPGASGRDCFK